MLNILIVDDNDSKANKIKDVIDTVIISGEYDLSVAINAYDAYVILKKTKMDLLILDINIPMRVDSPPKRNGGISLLNKISRDPIIKRPSHIVGLTEYNDILEEYSQTFSDSLWHLIKYDGFSNEWSNAMSEKINHILACKSGTKRKKIKILFLAADPSDEQRYRLMLDKEAREIEEKIKQSEHRDSLEFITKWAVRTDDLLLAFNENKPDIVHFSGHGRNTGELIVLDSGGKAKPVPVEGLKKLFETMKDNIRIVLLNACYSEEQAKVISGQIDCCIGIKDTINDQAAIEFAAVFYRAIGFSRSVQNAFDQGITALTLHNLPNKNSPRLICRTGCDPEKVLLI